MLIRFGITKIAPYNFLAHLKLTIENTYMPNRINYNCDFMKIKLTGVFVNDQDNALKFYTEVLGFVKKKDI